NFADGRLTLLEQRDQGPDSIPVVHESGLLLHKVKGPPSLLSRLGNVHTADSLAEALSGRASLPAGHSFITRSGEWVGRDWLRVSRGTDHHAGVIEREHRLKASRGEFSNLEAKARSIETHLNGVRQSLAEAEAQRDRTQASIQAAHRSHSDL